MRTGAVPGAADAADDLAARDLLAWGDVDGREVSVERAKAVAVIDHDQLAIATKPSRIQHHPAKRRANRTPHRGGDVDTLMELAQSEDRVAADPES